MFLLLLLLLPLLFAGCGAIQNLDIGHAHGNYVGDVTLYWQACRPHDDDSQIDVVMGMRQRLRGYMGVATRTRTLQGAHHDTDLVLAWFDPLGAPHVDDMFSQSVLSGCAQYGTCTQLDTALGGRSDVELLCGWQSAARGTFIAWQRRGDTGDPFDAPWTAKSLDLMWAATNVSLGSLADVNSIAHLHCADCSSPYYAQCTRQCPLQGETGYMERDRALTIRLVGPLNKLPLCAAARAEFQALLCSDRV
jgi:hypothetical protein